MDSAVMRLTRQMVAARKLVKARVMERPGAWQHHTKRGVEILGFANALGRRELRDEGYEVYPPEELLCQPRRVR